MSRAVYIQVAEDVKTLLNSATSGTFSIPFTAARRYVPVNPVEDMDALTVSVVPKTSDGNFLSRDTREGTYEIDVAFQKRLAKAEDVDEIDPLTFVMEQAELFLCGDNAGVSRRVLATSGARLLASKVAPIYDPIHMRDHGVFTGLITLTYESTRAFR